MEMLRSGKVMAMVESRMFWLRFIVVLITAGGEVDACRECAEGVCLGILTVAPLYLETRLFTIVGHILLAVDGVLIAGKERAAVPVSLLIVACSR